MRALGTYCLCSYYVDSTAVVSSRYTFSFATQVQTVPITEEAEGENEEEEDGDEEEGMTLEEL